MKSKTRKLIWSAPLVAVLAVVGALAIFIALAPNLAQAHDVPGVPTDLSAMPVPDDTATPEVEGRTQIKLTWKAPSGENMDITGYRIDRSKEGHVWMKLEPNSGDPDMLEYTDTVTGSASGMTYFYRVFAVNTSGVGPMSVIEDGTTMPLTVPKPPTKVMATADGATAIVLKWMPPADDGGKAVTKYRIHIDPPGTDNAFPALDTSDVAGTADNVVVGDICEFSADGGYLQYTHTKRMANMSYRYQVYAINSVDVGTPVGTSNGSAVRNATTGPKKQPDAPMDVLAVQSSSTDVQLYWNWPKSDGGAAITSFRVEVTEKSGDWPDSTAAAETTATNLSAADVSKGAFTVEATGNLATRAGEAHEVAHMHGFNTTESTTPTGVGKTLYYRVFTVTGTGQNEMRSRSIGSVSVKLVGDADSDDAVDLPPMLTAVEAGPPAATDDKHGNYSKLALTWTKNPDDNPTSYRIDYSSDGIKWMELEKDTRLAKPGEYTDAAGLKPAMDRHYRIFAKLGGKFRAATKSTPTSGTAGNEGMTGAAIAPDNVRNIMATAKGADMIEVQWEQPMYDGGASITHYQVQKSDDGNAWTVAAHLAVKRDANSCMLDPIGTWTDKGLSAGDTMYYRVYAVNSASTPSPAADTLATTADNEADPETDHATTGMAMRPDAPTGLTAELAKDSKLKGAGQQGVLVLWNAPKDPAGSPISGYRVERKVMGEDVDAWVELEASSSAMQTHYTDRNKPAAGEMRDYRVAAINRLANDAEGLSNWSNMASIPVGTHTHNQAPTSVGKITDMTVRADQMSTPLNVSTYFKDADPDDTLTYSATSSMTDYATVEIGGDDMNMLTITGVAVGEATITVTANDGNGGTATQTIAVTVTKPNQPPMLMGELDAVTLTMGDDPKTVDVSVAFSDADDDTLTYTATSSRTDYATVMVDGSMVTITGVAAGEATIMVTATDPAGEMAKQTFMVTVEAANMAPMPEGKIADVMLTVDQMSSTMDVSAYFTDADMDDTLTYTEMSSDDMIATAEIDGDDMNMLTITGVAVGMATITVTANDGNGGTATQTIAVTVTKPNQPPMLMGELDAVTLTMGDDPKTVDVSVAFSDADDDTLTYTATSSRTDYATVMVDGSMVTITGVAAGEATIMVTATDPAGEMAKQTFMVTVEAANMAPMPEGKIADVMLTVDQMSSTMDVSAYFTDADMDDTLTYTEMSSDDMIATAEIDGDDMNMLTITGVAVGMATITVTANDGNDGTAEQTIMVTVEAASMELTAPTGAKPSLFHTGIIVKWDVNSAQNADLIVVALFNEGVTALANIPNNIHPINLKATNDPGTHSFNNVPSGTYEVAVASESDGVYKVGFADDVITVP